MSSSNVNKVHTLINAALNKAENWGMIHKNPASQVDAPKIHYKEVNVWSRDETNQFLDLAKDSRYYTAYLLALTTGMRRGEVLGLRWRDIDFDEEILHISQTLNKYKELVPGAKTKAGRRTISLPDETITELKKHKTQIIKEKLAAGKIYQDHDLVICTEIGSPCDPSNFVRNFKLAIHKAAVKNIRFHDLRHTHATLLMIQGVNPKIVAERLGHADVRITLERYSHLMPSMQKDTAKAFGKMLFGKNDDKNTKNQQDLLKESITRYSYKMKAAV